MGTAETASGSGILDEAYERFLRTGPEFGGFLSNHGPMAVEAMVRHGRADAVHRWVDRYSERLEDQPRGLTPVTDDDWREALGAYGRVADWTSYFTRAVAEDEWRDVLALWWPRLLPGIVAGATHAVIRVGHAVRTLLDDPAAAGDAGASRTGTPPISTLPLSTLPIGTSQPDATDPRLLELAHALAYWAARWQPVAGNAADRTGHLTPADAIAAVPLVADQTAGVSHRVPQLATTAGWQQALDALTAASSPDEASALIAGLADAATLRYLTHGHGDAVLLVHAATAPTAVLRTLPALPPTLWIPSLDAAWSATATVTATFSPREAALVEDLAGLETASSSQNPAELLARAVEHGDEHVIKFADTAVDVYARIGDGTALVAATRSAEMIEPLFG